MEFIKEYLYMLPILLPLSVCSHLICILLYKKLNEIQPPTYFYSELNKEFYKPFINDEGELDEENIEEEKEINEEEKEINEEEKEINKENITENNKGELNYVNYKNLYKDDNNKILKTSINI